jgi:7,8-dihydropterin-6-yl-methyl-4-(beta-D-ribofuranosyl)aminobenzene 5'-phosphate synthase
LELRITVLCDNIVGLKSNLLGEHGLAILIERGEESYLFDTGQGQALFHNAATLGKDLRKVKKIFLSHGHYDHTGGLEKVLALKGERDIWIHPHAFLPRFSIEKGDETKIRNIGMKCSWIQLEEMGGRFHFINSFSEIEEGIYLTGEIPRTTPFEKGDEDLRIELEGKLVHDTCMDDQSLVIDRTKGLIILLGCAHAGIINTLTYIQEKMDTRKIFAIIGGTHLNSAGEYRLRETFRYLKELDFKKLGLSHCTGMKAVNHLMNLLKERVFIAHTGFTFEV